MPKVSIIILTYDSAKYISNLLESISRFHKGLENIEIIVVDNNSTDSTLDVLKKSRIEHQMREIPKNIGFSAGINAGAKNASGEYLLFINPDTYFKKGDVWEMVDVFENNPKVGVVGGKLTDNGNIEKSAGKFFGSIQATFSILGLDSVMGVRFSPNKEERVDFVSGGFMMVKKDLFNKLNGFDEDYFMYVEDVDLCKRAKKLNYQTYFTPKVEINHASHGSSNRIFAIENICKGMLIYHQKHSSKLVFNFIKFLLKLKAYILVLIGRIINNNYLVDAYIGVLRI